MNRMIFVQRKVVELPIIAAPIAAERVDRAGLSDALDAGAGSCFKDVVGAGDVDIKQGVIGMRACTGNGGQMHDGIAAVNMRDQRVIVADIAKRVAHAG